MAAAFEAIFVRPSVAAPCICFDRQSPWREKSRRRNPIFAGFICGHRLERLGVRPVEGPRAAGDLQHSVRHGLVHVPGAHLLEDVLRRGGRAAGEGLQSSGSRMPLISEITCSLAFWVECVLDLARGLVVMVGQDWVTQSPFVH